MLFLSIKQFAAGYFIGLDGDSVHTLFRIQTTHTRTAAPPDNRCCQTVRLFECAVDRVDVGNEAGYLRHYAVPTGNRRGSYIDDVVGAQVKIVA